MENRSNVRVTTDTWFEVVNKIDWRQPEVVDHNGNRIVCDINGHTHYHIPFDVWYDTGAYEKPWRRFMERTGRPSS